MKPTQQDPKKDQTKTQQSPFAKPGQQGQQGQQGKQGQQGQNPQRGTSDDKRK